MEPPERLTIRWDGFMTYRRKLLRELREKDEFNDVTLIAGDGKPVRARQVILAGGSSFFYTILKDNVQEDPSIYLTGASYEHLVSLLDYIYTGEANIAQEDFNQFLDIAEELKVNGLFKNGTLEETDNKKAKLNIFTPASLQSLVPHEEPCPSLKVSNPDSAISSTQDPVAVEERSAATRITALHEGQVATQKRSTALRISAPHEGQVATEERVSERSSKHPDIVTSPQSKNLFPQSTCMEDHGVTYNVKVELEDGSHFNVYYGTNEYGESYIREVSKRVDVVIPSPHESQLATVECASSNLDMSHSNNTLPKSTCMEDNGDISNVKVDIEDDANFDVYYGKQKHGEEYIRNVSKTVGAKVQRTGLCMEQKNYQSVFTGRNEENNNSVSEAQVKQAKIIDNDLSIHDWYQRDNHPLKKCSVDIKKMTIPKLTEVSSKSSISSENCYHEENLDKKDNSMRSFDMKGMVDSNIEPPMFSTAKRCRVIPEPENEIQIEEKIHNNCEVREVIADVMKVDTDGENGNIVPIPCGACNKVFHNASTLLVHCEKHMEGKGTGTRYCPYFLCSYTGSRTAMLQHLRAKHTREKLFKCSSCEERFAMCKMLKSHVKNVH